MAKQANAVSINVIAYDGASATLKQVENNVRRLPESFSKAAAGLSVLEGALGNTGGAAVQAAGKMAGLVSMVGVGGPIGIGIAAISGAVAIGTKVWETYQIETENNAAAQRSLIPVFAAVEARLQKQRDKVKGLIDDLRTFGMTANQKATVFSEEELDRLEKAGPIVEKSIAQEKERLFQLDLRLRKEQSTARIANNGRDVQTAATEALEEDIKRQKESIAYLERGAKARIDNIALIKKELSARQQQEDFAFIEEESKAAAEKRKEAARKREEDHKRELVAYQAAYQDFIRRKEAQDKKYYEDKEQIANKWETRINRGLDEIAEGNFRRRAELIQKESTAQEQRQEQIARYAEQAAGIISGNVEAMIRGEKTASEAARDASLQIMQSAVREAAVVFATRQMASAGGWLPGIGILVGGAAAAAGFEAVMAWANKGKKMARGGMVQGGIPYQDSVPIMAQQGEGFLSRDNVNTINRLISALDGFQMRGPQLAGAGAGGVSISLNSVVPYSPADVARARKSINKITRGR